MSIRVLIADDHDIVRDGLPALLENQPDIEVVESVSNGYEALNWLRVSALNFDVVVLDISMPGINGLEVTGEIRKNGWPYQVVILPIYTSEVYVWRAFRLGARGYISKESVGSDLVRAIRAAGAGQYCTAYGLTQLH